MVGHDEAAVAYSVTIRFSAGQVSFGPAAQRLPLSLFGEDEFAAADTGIGTAAVTAHLLLVHVAASRAEDIRVTDRLNVSPVRMGPRLKSSQLSGRC